MDWIEIWAGKNKAKPSSFRQNLIPPENYFLTNYVVEAADLRIAIHDSPTDRQSLYNSSNNHRRRRPLTYSLAKVIDKEGPRIRLRHLGTDDRNDIWMMVDSDLLRPYPSGKELSVPFGFMNSHSVWSKILSKVDTDELIAPPSWFPQNPKDPGSNLFKIGEKLEAVDRRNAQLICPATIGEIKDNYVLVKFDGWSGNFDYWTVYNSQDLFPVGWCCKANYKLQYPGPGYDMKLSHCKSRTKSGNSDNINTNNEKIDEKSRKKTIKRKQTNVYTRISRSVNKNKSKSLAGLLPIIKHSKSGISSPDSESTHVCSHNIEEEEREDENNNRQIIRNINLKRKNSYNELFRLHNMEKKWRSLSTNTNDRQDLEEADDEDDKDEKRSNITNNNDCISEASSESIKREIKESHINEDNYSISCDSSSHYNDGERALKKSISDQLSHSNSEDVYCDDTRQQRKTENVYNSQYCDNKFFQSPHINVLRNDTSLASNNCVINNYQLTSDTSHIQSEYDEQDTSLLTPIDHISNNDEDNINMPSDPNSWSVDDVNMYLINKSPNLESVANQFKNHEIDGQALLLLTMNTLRQYMKIKLGPAIKIENIIKNLQQGKL